MNRDGVKQLLLDAAANGTLLTTKHDPSSVGTAYPGYRSVTVGSSSGVVEFLQGDQYVMHQYEDARRRNMYVEIVPHDAAIVPGSGIPAQSAQPTHACNRFVAVSGAIQGWHIFAEEDSVIQGKLRDGDLIDRGEL